MHKMCTLAVSLDHSYIFNPLGTDPSSSMRKLKRHKPRTVISGEVQLKGLENVEVFRLFLKEQITSS